MKKIIGFCVVIFSLILLIGAGTYSYWIWTSEENKSIIFNTSLFVEEDVIYDEGNSYFIGNFQPVSTFCGGANNTISFYKTSDISNVELVATVNMDVNSIGQYISSSNDVYWAITSGDNNSCSGNLSDTLAYGTFNGIVSGTTFTLLSNIEVTTTIKQYTIWIWIDENGSNLSLLSGENFDTNVWTRIDMLDVSQ